MLLHTFLTFRCQEGMIGKETKEKSHFDFSNLWGFFLVFGVFGFACLYFGLTQYHYISAAPDTENNLYETKQ